MKNRIIEICELGQPQSIIHREKEPITELIKTDSLIEELNKQLLLHNVSQQRELLKAYSDWHKKYRDSSYFDPYNVDNYLNSL